MTNQHRVAFVDYENSPLMVSERIAAILGVDFDRGEPLDTSDPLADMGTLVRTIETAGPPAKPNRAQRRAAARGRR